MKKGFLHKAVVMILAGMLAVLSVVPVSAASLLEEDEKGIFAQSSCDDSGRYVGCIKRGAGFSSKSFGGSNAIGDRCRLCGRHKLQSFERE